MGECLVLKALGMLKKYFLGTKKKRKERKRSEEKRQEKDYQLVKQLMSE